MRRTPTLLCLLALGSALLVPQLLANDDVPHEKKGFQESGYALSQYENINLANGNLTYQAPLYTLRTDGGLEYPLTAYYNSKVFYRKQYCSLAPNGYSQCEGDGGAYLSANIAEGVPTYGFGWDLRPPRITDAFVDASGARHLLRDTPPWDPQDVPPMTRYTSDGTNYRFTTLETDENRPTVVRMEDGQGRVYIFSQVVPSDCSTMFAGLNSSLDDLSPYNFRVQVSGLYLTEIQKGPWQAGVPGGVPANRITFEYLNPTTDFDDDCAGQWLLSRITAHGQVDRAVEFAYKTEDVGGVETTVLDSVTVPSFDPTLGNDSGCSSCTSDITWSVSSMDFRQYNGTGAETFSFAAPYLTGITFPDAAAFTFTQSGDGFLTDVTLPSGALVQYEQGNYTVGKVDRFPTCTERDGDPCARTCGVPLPDPAPHDTRTMYSPGVVRRSISYFDASGQRRESTLFGQTLNCLWVMGGLETKWPYDFERFLSDDSAYHGSWEYSYTVVVNQPGPGSIEGVAETAEIHRFHPLTMEEFSVDYVEGSGVMALFSRTVATETASGEGIGNGAVNPVDVRVLRHVEIEKAVLPGDWDDKTLEIDEDRYVFTTDVRTFTDTASTPATQDVGSCYPMVTPGAAVTITCTEVRKTTAPEDVDDYLNSRLTTIQTFNSPDNLEVTRTMEAGYGYSANGDGSEDAYVWALGVKSWEEVTENGQSTQTGYYWESLSDPSDTSDPPDPNDSVQRFYVVTQQTVNPTLGRGTTDCTADCVRHDFGYDSLGNLTTDLVSGGVEAGFEDLNPSVNKGTLTTYTHGRATMKHQVGDGDTMLLWEREVDPSTGLTRWHVDGSGMGFAYLYDAAGRFTDIAPIDGWDSSSRGDWSFALQTTSVDGVITPMKGSHIEYGLPSQNNLLRHKVFDATWGSSTIGSQLSPGDCDPLTDTPRNIFRFDGLGRLTQETEAYPEGTRSRFHLTYLHADSPLELCDQAHIWDIADKSRVNLDSEWFDDGELPLNDGFPGCPTSLGSGWTAWTETQLDGLGRPRRVHSPDGTDLTREYHGDAITVSTRRIADDVDPAGNAVLRDFITTATSDGFGRLRRLEEEVSKLPATTFLTTYAYNERDQLTDVLLYNTQLSASQPRHFEYWESGFVERTEEPERILNFQGYDAVGNLRKELANGSVAVYHDYDGFGRLVESREEGSTPYVVQTWGNPHGGVVAVGNPGYNRVVTATRHNRFGASDVPVTHQWTYGGPGGRPSQRHTIVGGFGTGSEGFDIGYGYDTWGNASEVDFPYFAGCRFSNWKGLERSFDGEWPTATSLVMHNGAATTVSSFAYHPSGRVASVTYGGDTTTKWEEWPDPDGMARPERIVLRVNDTLVPGGTTGDYRFDGSGNVYAIGGKRFEYDGLSRLEGCSVWGDTQRTLTSVESYGYDRWGNVTQVDGPTSSLTFEMGDAVTPTGVPDTNRIASVITGARVLANLGWDVRGNLAAQPETGGLRGKAYLWTSDDRLKEAADDATGMVWRYAYDAAGERVARWTDDPSGLLNATVFVRDEGGQVVSEWVYAAGGAAFDVKRDYVAAGGRTLAQVDYAGTANGAVEYFAVDHLGSTRVVFNDAGAVLDTLDYLPFGQLATGGTTDTTTLFTGQERDLGTASSELDFFHQRYLSPGLLRFVSVDPVEGNTSSSQSHNRYSFVLNNPLKLVDPDGRDVVVAARPVNDFRPAAHSYLVITPTGANRSSERFSRYSQGKNRFTLSGGPGGAQVGQKMKYNVLVKFANNPEDEMGDATQLFPVPPPDGMSMEEFERRILGAYEGYKNGSLHYGASDIDFHGRNSNAFTSGVLSAAGVDVQALPSLAFPVTAGWRDPIDIEPGQEAEEGDTQTWLEWKKAQMARERQAND